MKLAYRFAVVIVAGMWIICGLAAFLAIEHEQTFLRADIVRDNTLIGQQLATAVETVWQLSGEAGVRSFFDQISRNSDRVTILWVPSPSIAGDSSSENASHTEVPGLGIPWPMRSDSAIQRLFTRVPVVLDGRHLGTIELAESPLEEAHVIRTSTYITLVAMILVGIVSGIIAMLLSTWMVGRPVKTLISKARQVAVGNLSSDIAISSNDEFGELAVELRKMSNQLASAYQRVEEETSAHQMTIAQLRHVNRLTTIGKLASVIAHELGTPLNVILARSKMIANGEIEGEEACESNRVIINQASRMTSIIGQLLNSARRRAPKVMRIDLTTVVREVVSVLSPLAQSRGINIQFNPGDDPAMVDVDTDQIQQVLSNLIINAIEAMPEGGKINVGICREESAPPSGNRSLATRFACVYVRDEGIGISEENLKRLFNPFFTTKGNEGGTGLGLSISEDIVHEHSGWIDVESRLGVGTTFTVFLPQESQV